jgi:acyl-CoA thioester hydrolase
MPHPCIYVRVPFSDVDSSNRIHFTAMLRYMENAEHELVRALGFPRSTSFPDMSFPRVHVSCDYRRAVGYDDDLVVEARVEHVGRSSWSVFFAAYFTEEAKEQANPQYVAIGKTTIVGVDRETQRARPLPDELRQALINQQEALPEHIASIH